MIDAKLTVVITSIKEPNDCLRAWINQYRDSIIVIGDLKTPDNWFLDGCKYFGPKSSSLSEFQINTFLPFNHYSRKMLGYLLAIKNGATVLIDTDDDNMPLPSHGFPDFDGLFESVTGTSKYTNPFKFFLSSYQHIWPRGFPLNLVLKPTVDFLELKEAKVRVWQGLANGDTDVDAIYRLTSNQTIDFKDRDPIVLTKGILAPFNSQNTAFHSDVFPLLYLPGFVPFRFTDILRGYVAQHVMQAKGFSLGFSKASVYQDRNFHDYLRDFESEVSMYLQTERINDVLSRSTNSELSVLDNLLACYENLNSYGFVSDEEISLLGSWKTDLNNLGY